MIPPPARLVLHPVRLFCTQFWGQKTCTHTLIAVFFLSWAVHMPFISLSLVVENISLCHTNLGQSLLSSYDYGRNTVKVRVQSVSLKFERKNKFCAKIIQFKLLLPGLLLPYVVKYLTYVSTITIDLNSQQELYLDDIMAVPSLTV